MNHARFLNKGRHHVLCEDSADDVAIQPLLHDTVYEDRHYDTRRLRHHLARLYPDEANIRRVLADAGIEAMRIPFGTSVETVWHSVLTEAEKSEKANAKGE